MHLWSFSFLIRLCVIALQPTCATEHEACVGFLSIPKDSQESHKLEFWLYRLKCIVDCDLGLL